MFFDPIAEYSVFLSNYNFFNFNDSIEIILKYFDFRRFELGIQKIRDKKSFPSFNFCSILTVPSGSNSEMINGLTKVSDQANGCSN